MDFQPIWSFCAVAREGNFTRAATWLRVDKSKVSRDVTELETRLGAKLLLRTTRTVRLTPEGQSLYERAQPAFAALESALAAAEGQQMAARGEVTFATTPELGRVLATTLTTFRLRHPHITLKLDLATRLVDLTREGIDLALRLGRPGGEGGTARRVGQLSSGFYAAPSYLARRGRPSTPEQLAEHMGLWPSPAKGQRTFAFSGKVGKAVVECSDFEMLKQLALRGAGITLLPDFLAASDVFGGALERVLPSVSVGASPLFLVSGPPRTLPQRVVLLRQHLLEELPRILNAS